MWKPLLALALLGASARGDFVEALVGRVMKTANPAQAHNPLFDTDHVAALVEHLVKADVLEVERGWDSVAKGGANGSPSKTSTSSTSTTTATKTSKSSTSTTATTPSPTSHPPCYNPLKFGHCFNAWTNTFGFNSTGRMNISMNSVVTALKNFSSAQPGNLDKVCTASTKFPTCVGNQTQFDNCVLVPNLLQYFKTPDDAKAAHDLAYMLPAECSPKAKEPFKTIKKNYKCFTKVNYTMEYACAKNWKDSQKICQNLVDTEFHCIPNLYKAACGNGMAKAMCQLLHIQLAALPDLKKANVSACNAHCEIYNGAPSTGGLPLALVLAAALLALLHL